GLCAAFLQGDVQQVVLPECLANEILLRRFVRQGIAAFGDINLPHGVRQKAFVKSRDGECSNADLEAMRRSLSAMCVMLHVPKVTELMLGAGSSAAGLRRL